jgi:hypothetical protein
LTTVTPAVPMLLARLTSLATRTAARLVKVLLLTRFGAAKPLSVRVMWPPTSSDAAVTVTRPVVDGTCGRGPPLIPTSRLLKM